MLVLFWHVEDPLVRIKLESMKSFGAGMCISGSQLQKRSCLTGAFSQVFCEVLRPLDVIPDVNPRSTMRARAILARE